MTRVARAPRGHAVADCKVVEAKEHHDVYAWVLRHCTVALGDLCAVLGLVADLRQTREWSSKIMRDSTVFFFSFCKKRCTLINESGIYC
jgi:hypothetical protein